MLLLLLLLLLLLQLSPRLWHAPHAHPCPLPSLPDGISLLKLDGSPPAPSAAPSDAASTGNVRPSSRSGLSTVSAAGVSSSLVALDPGAVPLSAAAASRPVTPRSPGAALEALKKFDAGSGGMMSLTADAISPASVPIGLGLHLLRPTSASRHHASHPARPPSAALAGSGFTHATRPVTPKGPLTALVAQQSAAAAAAAASVASVSLFQVSNSTVLFAPFHLLH